MSDLRDQEVRTLSRIPETYNLKPPTALLDAVAEIVRAAFSGNLSVHYRVGTGCAVAMLYHCGLDAVVWDRGDTVSVGIELTNKNQDTFAKLLRNFDIANPASTPEAIAEIAIVLLTPND